MKTTMGYHLTPEVCHTQSVLNTENLNYELGIIYDDQFFYLPILEFGLKFFKFNK